MSFIPPRPPVPPPEQPTDELVIRIPVTDAQKILDDLAALRGATAVEWQTQTPALNKLANTLILLLHPGAVA